eukprot:10075488-Karenia_brevis.AAC.1
MEEERKQLQQMEVQRVMILWLNQQRKDRCGPYAVHTSRSRTPIKRRPQPTSKEAQKQKRKQKRIQKVINNAPWKQGSH